MHAVPSGGVEDPETTRINQDWQQAAFPGYLQNGTDDFCQAWEEALQVCRVHRGNLVAHQHSSCDNLCHVG